MAPSDYAQPTYASPYGYNAANASAPSPPSVPAPAFSWNPRQAESPQPLVSTKDRLHYMQMGMGAFVPTDAGNQAKMGIEASADIGKATDALHERLLAYLPLEVVSAPLARLISLRRMLGVRNVAHTLVKLLCPVAGPALLLSAYTHPEFGSMLNELFAERGTSALLMRATEGEAVVNVRRSQEVLRWRAGQVETLAERAPSAAAQLPELPPRDAESTAAWTLAVLAGDIPAPESLLAQCDMIEESAGLLDRRKGTR